MQERYRYFGNCGNWKWVPKNDAYDPENYCDGFGVNPIIDNCMDFRQFLSSRNFSNGE